MNKGNFIIIVPWSRTKECWDLSNNVVKVLGFRNLRKLFYFAKYYSMHYDVLIRVYIDYEWTYSYCKGKEIWNCF